MPSKLILDPAEPGVNEVIAGMTVGQPIVLRELTVVPTMVDPGGVEADVTAVSIDENETMSEGEPIPEGEPGGAQPAYENLSDMPMENEGGFDQGKM